MHKKGGNSMHKKAMEMAKHAMEDACSKGYDCMTSQDWDDFKDCVETAKNAIECDYYYRLVERMKKDEEEEKREDTYFLNMLKEEYKDDYKRMKDEYGEDEGERRFYDNYRYMRTGRFAPKGRGTYVGRRGYTEMPMNYRMPDVYSDNDEWYRDMDRESRGKMYYSGSNMMNMSNGRSNPDSRSESRYDRARRGYEETKMMHKGNTTEDKHAKMRELENYAKELAEDVTEMIADATPEERSLLKQKMQVLIQKIG